MSTKSNPSVSESDCNQKHERPGRPILIQTIVTPKGTMNHTYSDYSQVRPAADYRPTTDIVNMTFSEKVHHILSRPEFEDDISWMPHGRAFKVHRPGPFEKNICKRYFGHGRYSSFLRQLNNYGFKHISQGTDRNCEFSILLKSTDDLPSVPFSFFLSLLILFVDFLSETGYYHQCMLKDRPHLCRYMPRAKDARRLVADPQSEPNFYRIPRLDPSDVHATDSSVHTPRVQMNRPTVVASTRFPTKGSEAVPYPHISSLPLPTPGVATTHANASTTYASATTLPFAQNAMPISSHRISSSVTPVPFQSLVLAPSPIFPHLFRNSWHGSLFSAGMIIPSNTVTTILTHPPSANGDDILRRLSIMKEAEQAERVFRATTRYA